MYIYPKFRPRANVATEAVRPDETQTDEAMTDAAHTAPLLRGFVFEEVRTSAKKPSRLPIERPTSSLQELGRLAASGSPYDNVDSRLKNKMMQDLATTSDTIFTLSDDGKVYKEPIAEKGWLSLDKLLLAEKDAQEKKHYYRTQAEAFGIARTDRKHEFRREEKVASDDCSKYAKIREIFGNGHGKYHPNQLVAKKYMPAQGLCEKELLYKFALKISNLQELYQKKKLAMDPYDFYRWVICKNLKSDLHNALHKSRNSLAVLVRSMGDDGRQADPVFRTIVLYWASLTGKDNTFGGHKKSSRPCKQPSTSSVPKLGTSPTKVGLGGRDLARRLSRLEMRRRKRRDQASLPKVYGGVNALRAEKNLAAAEI